MTATVGDAVPAGRPPGSPRGRRVVALLGLVAAGVLLGAGGGWLADDPHVARTERLASTAWTEAGGASWLID
ncbi:hypothetical protein ABZS66_32670 [Dactylosporangium sp. NPDC005572]|uniref:hypothetical protein n=1 Tax=Dactylosporangium sp. NPDC005572 TaxID=3156889 RepID=UPI0033AFD1A4